MAVAIVGDIQFLAHIISDWILRLTGVFNAATTIGRISSGLRPRSP
jgi:hypothetical protein